MFGCPGFEHRTVHFGLYIARQQPVEELDEPVVDPHRGRRGVERLELDQQLVDDPGDALPAVAAHSGPGGADGVDLLDEADGAALGPGGLAQGLEVGADLPVGLAVVHRLEGRRRDEQERHLGLPGHGPGHVGLARPRRALEKDGPAGGATHALLEGLVGQEEVEALHHLVDDDRHPLDVGQRRLDLTRPVQHVGRAPGAEERQQDGGAEHDHQQQQRHRLGDGRVEVRAGREGRVPVEDPVPHPDADEPHHRRQAEEAPLA